MGRSALLYPPRAQHGGGERKKMGMITIRAVIVSESMYGDTHLIADAVAAGLGPGSAVIVVTVCQASPTVLANADLVVVGGPTHAHGMSRAGTRTMAVEAANKPTGGLTVEPGAAGPGPRLPNSLSS